MMNSGKKDNKKEEEMTRVRKSENYKRICIIYSNIMLLLINL